MNGIESIAAERQRQVDQEGWTSGHDDKHVSKQMASAATCYLLRYAELEGNALEIVKLLFGFLWPWSKSWWKPKTPRKDLVRAGALIAAEIDRIDRLKSKNTHD